MLGRRARTFCVGGHHYALVVVEDLEPGQHHALRGAPRRCAGVAAAGLGVPAEPDPDGRRPGPFRLAFGSCRYASPQTVEDSEGIPPDALDLYASRIAARPEDRWPDALVLLGDQVYADELTEADEVLAGPPAPPGVAGGRRAPRTRWRTSRSTPGSTCESWGDPQVRWLLSTIPSSMIFDDHEMIDDWNTSAAWRQRITREALVDRADHRRAGQLLGLPAPGQPQPAGAGAEQDLAGDPGPRRDDDARDAEPMLRRDGRAGRRRAGHDPVELRAALGRRAADHDRQPGRSGAGGAAPPDAGRGRVRLGRGGDAPRGRRGRGAPDPRHLAALAAAARDPQPRAVERDAQRPAPRPVARAARPRRCARPPTWSTGRRSGTPSSGSAAALTSVARGEHGRAPATRAGPLRRRPPRLRRRGDPARRA